MIHVIAKLDRPSRARLSWIQSFAASFGIVPRPIYGHIELAALDNRDRIAGCKAALESREAFTADFQSLEILEDGKVIAAVAVPEGGLAEVRCALMPGDDDWTPCTVLLRDNVLDLNWVRTAMGGMFQPFTAKVERIEFMEDGEVIDGMDLKGERV